MTEMERAEAAAARQRGQKREAPSLPYRATAPTVPNTADEIPSWKRDTMTNKERAEAALARQRRQTPKAPSLPYRANAPTVPHTAYEIPIWKRDTMTNKERAEAAAIRQGGYTREAPSLPYTASAPTVSDVTKTESFELATQQDMSDSEIVQEAPNDSTATPPNTLPEASESTGIEAPSLSHKASAHTVSDATETGPSEQTIQQDISNSESLQAAPADSAATPPNTLPEANESTRIETNAPPITYDEPKIGTYIPQVSSLPTTAQSLPSEPAIPGTPEAEVHASQY
jgi:hypothetical protein